MSGLWFKVYEGVVSHEKWDRIKDEHPADWGNCWGLWIEAAAHVSQQLTDGSFKLSRLRRSTPMEREDFDRAAAVLVTVGLWDLDGDGHRIHDWEDWQPTKVQIQRQREQATIRKRRERERRKAACHAVTHAVTHAVSHAAREEKRREEEEHSPPGKPGAGVSAGQGQEGASQGEPGAGVDHCDYLGAEHQAAELEPPSSPAKTGKRLSGRKSAENNPPQPSLYPDHETANSGAVSANGGAVGDPGTTAKAENRTKRAPGQAKAELESVLLDAINAARAQHGLTPQGVNGPIKAIRDAAGRMAGKWTADQVRTAVVLRVKELKPEWVKADTILRIDRFTAALEIVRDNAQPNTTTATGPGTKPAWLLEQERQQAQGGLF